MNFQVEMQYPTTFLAIFFFFALNISAQTFCLQIVEISNNGTDHVIELQAMGSADFNLGSSNLQFGYNTAAINNPVFDSSPLAPPFYQVPTVTNPAIGQASFNIELAFANFGTTVSSTSWTPLGQVRFDIVDPTQNTDYSWSYNGSTTQTIVFLDDETTQIFATNTTNACLIALDVVLPLDLLDFKVQPSNKQAIQLEWSSVNEQNFLGFEIERSTDGRSFTKIEFIPGKNNSQTEQYYSLTDRDVFANQVYYYRLKMLDLDESFTYSKIRQAKLNGIKEFNIYPNPTQGIITLDSHKVQWEGNAQISLTNVTQQTLFTYDLPEVNQQSKIELNLSNYSSGIYYLKVKIGDNVQWRKIVLE